MADFTIKGNKDVYRFSIEKKEDEDETGKNGKFAETFPGTALIAKEKVIVKRLGPQHRSNPAAVKAITAEYKIQAQGDEFPKVYDFFESGTAIYLIRQWIPGKDLKEILESSAAFRKLNPDKKLSLAISITEALVKIHQQGIIHRDIRPGNILIRNWEEFKSLPVKPEVSIIDFGLAMLQEEMGKPQPKTPFALLYSPPEQLLNRNELVGPWSDIFALGLVFYEIFSGSKAYYHDNPELLMNLQLNTEVKADRDIPPAVFAIILQCTRRKWFSKPPARMEKEEINEDILEGIRERIQSAETLLNLLKNIHPDELKSHQRPWWKFF